MSDKKAVNDKNKVTAVEAAHDVIYDLFILAITIYSLVVIVFLIVWPLTVATRTLLIRVDFLICIFLAIDFLINLYRLPDWRDYLTRQAGWLDLLGSVPIIVGPLWTAVFRLARLPRLARIVRNLRARGPQQIRQALRSNRPKGALFLTFLIAIVMIAVAGAVVLQVEGRSPEANIHTEGDAFWWAFVTITTVGYGDHVPVTSLGRLMAGILMTIGIGIFAVMTSFLASLFFVGGDEQAVESSLQDEIKELRQENAAMSARLEDMMHVLVQLQQNKDE